MARTPALAQSRPTCPQLMVAAPYIESPLGSGSLSIANSCYAALFIFKTILVTSAHHLLVMHFCGTILTGRQAGFDWTFQDNMHFGRTGKDPGSTSPAEVSGSYAEASGLAPWCC